MCAIASVLSVLVWALLGDVHQHLEAMTVFLKSPSADEFP